MERLHVIAETASKLVQDAYAIRKVLSDENGAQQQTAAAEE
jgi:hypothetical protein